MSGDGPAVNIHLGRPLVNVTVAGVSGAAPKRPPVASSSPSPSSTNPPPQPGLDAATLKGLFSQLTERVVSLENSRRESSRLIHQIAVELATAVTAKILFQAFEEDAFPVDAMVRELMQHLDPEENVVVYLNASDWEQLQQSETAREWIDDNELIEWRSGPELGRGSARMETQRFSLFHDCVLQLQEIRQVLMEVLGDAEVERRKTDFGGKSLRRFPDRRSPG